MRIFFPLVLLVSLTLCHLVKDTLYKSSNITSHNFEKDHLPPPSGKYSVGFIDIMTPGEPDNGTLMRLYYPTDEQYLKEHKKWPLWAYEEKYVAGFYTFLNSIGNHWPSWLPNDDFLLHDTLLPFLKLVPEFGFLNVFANLFGQIYVPIIKNATLKKPELETKWPTIVFSHGVGQGRFLYSQLCSDLASLGFIVAATEHREGSACASRYHIVRNEDEKCVKWISHLPVESSDEYAIRNRQVHSRSKELSRTLDTLIMIQNGKDIKNIFTDDDKSCRREDQHSYTLLQFKNSMNVNEPFVVGHSFGGSSILLTLAEDNRFKAGVALDPWMFPLKDENIIGLVHQPLIFINSESYSTSRNIEKVLESRNSSNFHSAVKKGYIIKGSVHQSLIDFPPLFKVAANSIMLQQILGLHSKTSPEVVMKINNNLVLQFLNENLGGKINFDIHSPLLIPDHRFTRRVYPIL